LDGYYNVARETSVDGIEQDNIANTLSVGAGMGLRLWRGTDLGLNYERVVPSPLESLIPKPCASPSAVVVKREVRADTARVQALPVFACLPRV
jgi:hypothetical protein